jgi:hypothetical protein
MGAAALPILIASTAVSAYGSIREGQDKKKYYNQMAQQTRVETERAAIKYEFQANQILQRTNAANAAVIARGFAGGVNAFEGSAGLIQSINNTRGGKEFAFALAGAEGQRRNGLIQASLYEDAGATAERTGYFNAAAKIGMAAVTASSLGGAPAAAGPAGGTATGTGITSGGSGVGFGTSSRGIGLR